MNFNLQVFHPAQRHQVARHLGPSALHVGAHVDDDDADDVSDGHSVSCVVLLVS